MSRKVFAVMVTRGPAWDDARTMDEQDDWRPHADFMNGLLEEGFVLLGGPLVGTRDVLLVVHAEDEAEIERRLAPDVWRVKDLLRTRRIAPWWLRLGVLS